MSTKIPEFDADLESVEKVAKILMRKKIINEKVTEKWSFWFLLYCAKVFGLQLFWVIFGTFSTNSNSASNFGFHDTGIKFLKKKIVCLKGQ
jgi:hypothetical protein